MLFRLTINCDNAAFGDSLSERHAEVARILAAAVERIGEEVSTGSLRDVNGNTVGRFSFDQGGE